MNVVLMFFVKDPEHRLRPTALDVSRSLLPCIFLLIFLDNMHASDEVMLFAHLIFLVITSGWLIRHAWIVYNQRVRRPKTHR